MDARHVLDGKAVFLMIILCLTWGLQQTALKAAGPDMAPVMQVALRSVVAFLFVALLIVWRRQGPISGKGAWRPGLLAGVFFALEFLFIAEGLLFTSSSRMVVFLYTSPAFTALALHFRLPEERLKPAQWLGIALCFAGIILAFCGTEQQAGAAATQTLKGDFYGLLAGVSWTLSTVVIRCSRLAVTPPTLTALYQLLAAALILMPAAFLMGQADFVLTPVVWTSLVFQSLVVSFATMIAWFWLLRNYLASRLGALSFMTPLFGVAGGVLLLGEALEPGFVAGALLVFAGIALVNGYEWLRCHIPALCGGIFPGRR